MRRLALVAAVLCALFVTACSGGSTSTPPPPPTTATSQPPTSPPTTVSPTPALGEPVPVPGLPDQGIAVQVGRSVALLTTQGRQIQRLHKYSLLSTSDAPGSVVLFGNGSYFKLDPRKDQLTPISAADAKALRSKHGATNLASPPGATVVPGRYGWSRQSPHSSTLLADFVASCGRSFAVLGSPGSTPTLITGSGGVDTAVASQGLGWTPDGHAVALVYDAGCGTPASQTDLILYTSAGNGSTVYRIGGTAAARMWGSS
jgi:hypothetical protein